MFVGKQQKNPPLRSRREGAEGHAGSAWSSHRTGGAHVALTSPLLQSCSYIFMYKVVKLIRYSILWIVLYFGAEYFSIGDTWLTGTPVDYTPCSCREITCGFIFPPYTLCFASLQALRSITAIIQAYRCCRFGACEGSPVSRLRKCSIRQAWSWPSGGCGAQTGDLGVEGLKSNYNNIFWGDFWELWFSRALNSIFLTKLCVQFFWVVN